MPFWKSKKKPNDRSRAIDRCKRLWGKAIRYMYPYCQKCGMPTVHAHHWISRQNGAKPFWFDLRYGIGLCFNCHADGAHSVDFDKQLEFHKFLLEWLEEKNLNYEIMKSIARANSKLTVFDILEYEKILKKYLNLYVF